MMALFVAIFVNAAISTSNAENEMNNRQSQMSASRADRPTATPTHGGESEPDALVRSGMSLGTSEVNVPTNSYNTSPGYFENVSLKEKDKKSFNDAAPFEDHGPLSEYSFSRRLSNRSSAVNVESVLNKGGVSDSTVQGGKPDQNHTQNSGNSNRDKSISGNLSHDESAPVDTNHDKRAPGDPNRDKSIQDEPIQGNSIGDNPQHTDSDQLTPLERAERLLFHNTDLTGALKILQSIHTPNSHLYQFLIHTLLDDRKRAFCHLLAAIDTPSAIQITAYHSYFTTHLSMDASLLYKHAAYQVIKDFQHDRFSFQPILSLQQTKTDYTDILALTLSNDSKATTHFIKLLKTQLNPKDHKQTLKHIARSGNPQALAMLGDIYLDEKNPDEAAHYYAEGISNADCLTGMYKVTQNVAYLEAATRRGSLEAACLLYVLKKDYTALTYLLNAANKGYLPALYMYADSVHCNDPCGYYAAICENSILINKLHEKARLAYEEGEYVRALVWLVFGAEHGSFVCTRDIIYLLEKKIKNYLKKQESVESTVMNRNSGDNSKNLTKDEVVPQDQANSNEQNFNQMNKLSENSAVPQDQDDLNGMTRPLAWLDADKLKFSLLSRLAQTGDKKHLIILGNCYFYGTGTQKCLKSAYAMYEAAALNKTAEGWYSLAYTQLFGLGCAKDYRKALQSLEKVGVDENAYLVVWYFRLVILAVFIYDTVGFIPIAALLVVILGIIKYRMRNTEKAKTD